MTFIDRTLKLDAPLLDLDAGIGQRSSTFAFTLIDGVTGGPIGQIHPIRTGSLRHDTSASIKRTLSLTLGVADTALIDPVNNRIDVSMILQGGATYQLGRYVFTSSSRDIFSAGNLSTVTLVDEMFIVDQVIESAIGGDGRTVPEVVQDLVEGLGVTLRMEGTPYRSTQAWGAGSSRGQILAALALVGDFFPPWFDNAGILRFIRSFDPAAATPTFDFDAGNSVIRNPITETDDLLTAPNRFIVISNSSLNNAISSTGVADVPDSAPHSIANRGFVVSAVADTQATDVTHAGAIAANLARRQTVFERVTLSTANDPRHDSYDVIIWNGQKWLEIGWEMALADNGTMSHLLRKAYT
jgi:hypothetical protein